MLTKEDAIKYMREGGVVEFHLTSAATALRRRILDGVCQAQYNSTEWHESGTECMSEQPGFYRPAAEPAPKKPFTREDAVKHMEAGGVVRWTGGVGRLGAWLRRIVGGVYMARFESNLEWKPTNVPMADGDDFYAPYYEASTKNQEAKIHGAKPAASWGTAATGISIGEPVAVAPTGKKFDSGKPRMSLVPVGVVNALLRVHHERDADYGIDHDDPKLLDEVAGDLLDGDYADALYDTTAALGGVGALGGLLEVVEVLEYGCKKYDEGNWQLVADAKRRYYDAAFRHLIAAMQGEERDPETGFKHLAHVGCNLVFLEYFKQKG